MTDKDSLAPIGRWDSWWRGSFELPHDGAQYVIDVDYFDIKERVRLYRDGQLIDTKKSPATFKIDENVSAKAAMSLYGMKQVDLIDGHNGQVISSFQPRSGTGEAWRAQMHEKHPKSSSLVGILSWTILVFAAVTQLPVIFNILAGMVSDFQLPTFNFPIWLDTTLTIAGILAALDRALQMKYNQWIDE